MSGRRMIFGVSASWVLMGTRMAVSFLLMPLLYHYVPAKLLGVWLLFASMGAVFAVSDLGLASATARALAWFQGRRGQDGSAPSGVAAELLAHGPEDLIRTVARSYLALGLAVLLVVGGFGFYYLGTLDLVPAALGEARWAWALYAGGLAFVLAGSTPNYVLQGLGDVGLEALAQALALWIGLLAQWLWLRSGGALLGLGAVFLLQAMATRALLWALLRKRHAWLFTKPGHYQPKIIRALLAQGFGLFISGLCGLFIFQVTPMLIASALGAEAVPDYNVLVVLAATGMQLAGALPSALMPFASARSAAGDLDGLRRLHSLAIKVGVGLQLCYVAVLLSAAPHWVGLWVGAGHFLGYPILSLLCVFFVLEQHHVANSVFTFSSGQWPFAPWSLAGGLLNTLLVYLALPRLGLLGAALGGVIAQGLTNNWYVVYYTLRRLGIGLGDYVRRVLFPLAGLALGLGLLAWAWQHVGPWPLQGTLRAEPLALLLPAFAGAGLLALGGVLGVWGGVLTASERRIFSDRLARRFGRSV